MLFYLKTGENTSKLKKPEDIIILLRIVIA